MGSMLPVMPLICPDDSLIRLTIHAKAQTSVEGEKRCRVTPAGHVKNIVHGLQICQLKQDCHEKMMTRTRKNFRFVQTERKKDNQGRRKKFKPLLECYKALNTQIPFF